MYARSMQALPLRITRATRILPRTSVVPKLTPVLQLQLNPINNYRFKTTMSGFSNTDTGSKAADPYKQKNTEEPSLKEKVEDLFAFVEKTKFCLLTTQVADSDLLATRAMGLAAQVRQIFVSRS